MISELALSLLANILSDTAKETLGKHYDPSLKAYKNAIKSLSDKYRLNITQIETFLHQENVKVAIKEYLENPNNHDLLNSLTDEFLSSFNENKFLKERESSILSEFFEFLYTEIKKDPELRNYLQHYLITEIHHGVQELSQGAQETNQGIREISFKIDELCLSLKNLTSRGQKIGEADIDIGRQIDRDINEWLEGNKEFYIIYLGILGLEQSVEVSANYNIELLERKKLIALLKSELRELGDYIKIIEVSNSNDLILCVKYFSNIFEAASVALGAKSCFKIVIGTVELSDYNNCYKNIIKECQDLKECKFCYEWESIGKISTPFVIAADTVVNSMTLGMRKYFMEKNFEYIDRRKDKKYYLINKESLIKERKVSEFIKSIGQQRVDYNGALIDRLFVPPDEFEEIKEKLNNDRIVFITGPPGYGKTYTAIRLMWEWYSRENNICFPEWVPGKEYEQRKEVREKLANIDAILRPHHIYYFEDPFGKTKYEGRDDLKQRIGHIIDSVKGKSDTYVIITSRKDIFQEFEKEIYFPEEVRKFEKELNIIKPSYNHFKRIEILEKWAEEKGCEWLEHQELRNLIIEKLKNENKLPTPLNIYDFVVATAGKQLAIDKENAKEELRKFYEKEIEPKIDKNSQATEKAFADEIKELYKSKRYDRIYFLSIIFISQLSYSYFSCDFVKKQYNILKKRNRDKDFRDFNKVLKEEYRIKLVKENLFNGQEEKYSLEFAHPSYSNALNYILDHDGCKEYFCDVLNQLIEEEYAAGGVAWIIVHFYNKFSYDEQKELISKLEENKYAFGDATLAIIEKYGELPLNVRSLVFKFVNNLCESEFIIRRMGKDYHKLSKDVKDLIINIASNIYASGDVFNEMGRYTLLPKELMDLIYKISENIVDTGDIGWGIVKNYGQNENYRNELVPLLDLLKENKIGCRGLVSAILQNYNNLPKHVQDLIFTLKSNEDVAGSIAWGIIRNYNNLPENVRNLVPSVIDNIETSKYIGDLVWIGIEIIENYGRYPEEITCLIEKEKLQYGLNELRRLLLESQDRDCIIKAREFEQYIKIVPPNYR